MEHAFIITAYRDFDLLERNAKIYAMLGDVYIHVDKRSRLPRDIRNKLTSIAGVEVFTKYSVRWGSHRHTAAMLYLIRRARQKKNYCFYHIITGDTTLCAKADDFKKFFEENADKNFIELIPVDERISKRYEYYYFIHLYDGKGEKGKRITAKLLSLQQKLKIKRKADFAVRGYFYCQLNGAFIDYLLNYLGQNKKYLKSLKYTFIGEEFFFQNIIINSPFKGDIVENHLIYDVWKGTNGSPEQLTEEDFRDIITSDKMFCRKVGRSGVSLMDKLEEYVLAPAGDGEKR